MKVVREKLKSGEKLFAVSRGILIPFGPRSLLTSKKPSGAKLEQKAEPKKEK